ncbi:DUF349 domain-containing protein [Janthinobacterium sp.]|uniref:DUF349 domain-containing protein n=1 Tax=Janthinobacterium sp. TaxID=1871054 RepID=UPI00293D3CC6|nr:DUF349 domain-containing protein [Janthinobacterium sp.]
MFDFLFKRSASKQSEPQAVVAEQTAVAAQAAARRAGQLAQARALAGDEGDAVAFILACEYADARLIAAEHVQGRAALEQVHQAMRNTDRRVAKLMQARLDLIRHAHSEQNKAQSCVDSAQRLLGDDKLSPNQVAELDRQWQVVQAAPALAQAFAAARAALALRLAGQVQLQRAVIDALAELRRLPEAALDAAGMERALEALDAAHTLRLADADIASLPKQLLSDFSAAQAQAAAALLALAQHGAAFEARRAALAGWRAENPAGLDGASLKRAWQSLPRLPENALADELQQQFETLLASAPAPLKAPEHAERAERTERAERAPAKAVDAHFLKALDEMEAALQQGLLQQASEHDKTLRENKSGRLTPAQSERLAHVRGEFKRLADWARWGGNVSREELVKAAEDMPAQEWPMAELAKKVGSLRERWKSLDSLSGHAPKALWERFDAACSLAYAPAALHFKQLAEERHGNAGKALELIAETQALAGAAGEDWKQIAAAGQRLRQSWTRLGTIERKEKKRLDTEFGMALDALAGPLTEQRRIETARREQLIVEVGLLKPMERNTIDMLRALQEKWQELARALPLERRAEQALWQRFRAACDEVFAKRKETAHAADHERREHLQARAAICAGLETAVIAEGDDKQRAAAIAAVLREARQAWHGAGPVPRASEEKIEQRYQAALATVQAQADGIVQRAGAAQADALRDKLRLCQALESAVAQPDAAAADWDARWGALAALEAQYERSLQARFGAARLALEGGREAYAALLEANRAPLREELLRLEIVAGVDSGAEFARERLKMQVEVLQSSLKSGQKPQTQLSQLLQLCAIPALADERTVSRIETLLRRIGAAGKDGK